MTLQIAQEVLRVQAREILEDKQIAANYDSYRAMWRGQVA
jgi:hypothetical protein